MFLFVFFLMLMAPAIKSALETFAGEKGGNLFETLVSLIAGDTKLENMLDPKNESFLEKFGKSIFKDKMAEQLGLNTEEIDTLFANGGALNDLLTDDAKTMTLDQMKALQKSDPDGLISKLFPKEVVDKLLIHPTFSPLAAKVAFNKPEMFAGFIDKLDTVPDATKAELKQAIASGKLKPTPETINELNRQMQENANNTKLKDPEKLLAAQALLSTAMLNSLDPETRTRLADITLKDALSSKDKAMEYLDKFASSVDWTKSPLSKDETAAYLVAQKDNILKVLGRDGLAYLSSPDNAGKLASLADFQTFLQSQENEQLIQIIKKNAENGNEVEESIATMIKGVPVDKLRGKTPEEKNKIRAYADLAAAIIPAKADAGVGEGGSNLDRWLKLGQDARKQIFSSFSGSGVTPVSTAVENEVTAAIKDSDFDQPLVEGKISLDALLALMSGSGSKNGSSLAAIPEVAGRINTSTHTGLADATVEHLTAQHFNKAREKPQEAGKNQ